MSARTSGRRPVGRGPRRARVRRASPRLGPVRAAAALVLLLAAAALYGAVSSSAFTLRQLVVDGVRYASRDAVATLLALPTGGANLVSLHTEDLERRLTTLSTVTGAMITIELPDTLRVRVVEREPILVWRWEGHRFLVDRDGLVFADASAPGTTSAARAAAGRLPIVEDRRVGAPTDPAQGASGAGEVPQAESSPDSSAAPVASRAAGAASHPSAAPTARPSDSPASGRAPGRPIVVGQSIDPFTFDAATRIASLTPTQIGSVAERLVVVLDDTDGFSLETNPAGWQAVFGFYSASIRSPELIPGQVRLLRSLMEGREATIRRVVLADERNGTYTVR